ncbi:MAG: rhodanese-like domain-containing protein [Planctomycetota bacterium]
MRTAVEHYEAKLDHEIDSWDLNEARQRGEAIVVIDTRSRAAYDAEHLPGAVSLPHAGLNESSTANFDHEPLYVTYCDGIGCNASTKGALQMSQLGFRVKELIGGLDWWRRDGYPTERAVVQINS